MWRILSTKTAESPGQCVSVCPYVKNPQVSLLKVTQEIYVTNRAKLISMLSHQPCMIKINPLNSSLICRPSSCVLFKKGGRIAPLASNALKPAGINNHAAELKDYISVFATPPLLLPHLISTLY